MLRSTMCKQARPCPRTGHFTRIQRLASTTTASTTTASPAGITGHHGAWKRRYSVGTPMPVYTSPYETIASTPALFSSTYPPNNDLINERHFYQNTVLMDWFAKEPRPVSLRQLAFFGRRLTEEKIISSANFVRTELPTRLAHRIRDLQVLPYSVVSNNHLTFVYQMYYRAFNRFRRFPVITTVAQNDEFCQVLSKLLTEHMIIIPHLVMGAIESGLHNTLPADQIDEMMSKMLRSRISRRVIAEQHLSLTKSFNSGDLKDKTPDFIGEVFLQCSAKETIEECYSLATKLVTEYHKSPTLPGVSTPTSTPLLLPELIIEGHTDTKFPYMKSHLDYIVGEIMRNNVEATVTNHYKVHPDPQNHRPPPIVVSIANTTDDILIRFSDQGGGVPPEILPHLWSFSKGPRSRERLKNFQHLPIMTKINEVSSNFGHSYKHSDENVTNPRLNSELNDLCHESESVKLSTTTNQSQIGWLPNELSLSAHFGGASGSGMETRTAGESSHTQGSSINNDPSLSNLSSLTSFTTRQPDLKLGMGLPMSRVYADYWNGALDLHSLEGHGCDVFLRISRLGNKNEKLQLDKV